MAPPGILTGHQTGKVAMNDYHPTQIIVKALRTADVARFLSRA
jgi:hypothetical protein